MKKIALALLLLAVCSAAAAADHRPKTTRRTKMENAGKTHYKHPLSRQQLQALRLKSERNARKHEMDSRRREYQMQLAARQRGVRAQSRQGGL